MEPTTSGYVLILHFMFADPITHHQRVAISCPQYSTPSQCATAQTEWDKAQHEADAHFVVSGHCVLVENIGADCVGMTGE